MAAFSDDKVSGPVVFAEDSAHKPLTKDGDKALEFLRTEVAPGEGDAINEKRLVRKIDFQIVPLMFSCYFLQYLDKSLCKSPTEEDIHGPAADAVTYSELCSSHGHLGRREPHR